MIVGNRVLIGTNCKNICPLVYILFSRDFDKDLYVYYEAYSDTKKNSDDSILLLNKKDTENIFNHKTLLKYVGNARDLKREDFLSGDYGDFFAVKEKIPSEIEVNSNPFDWKKDYGVFDIFDELSDAELMDFFERNKRYIPGISVEEVEKGKYFKISEESDIQFLEYFNPQDWNIIE